MRTAVVVLVCMLGGVGVANACTDPPEVLQRQFVEGQVWDTLLRSTTPAPPPVPALPFALVLAICGVVGVGYAFACSNAARLAYFRRTRSNAPSTPVDRELAERVVRRHGMNAALLAVGCIAGVLAIVSVPMGVASRVAMMVTPTFVAMVALATAIRLFWTASALAVHSANVQYDGAYYLFIVRGGRMRGWIGALPRSLHHAAATTLPKAVLAQH